MLILLPPGICAGKHSVASYLISKHGFESLFIKKTIPTPSVEKSADDAYIPSNNDKTLRADQTFATAEALMDFVTKRWRSRWVTTDIWDESVLEILLRRPFFILVSIDAPVSLRWQRFKDRYFSLAVIFPPTRRTNN